MKKLAPHVKRYIVSSLITFVSGFALAIYPMLDSLTPEAFSTGALIGLLFAGIRAGIKALIEVFLMKK